MNVLLYEDGKFSTSVCTWFPDAANSVFPLLIATKDGRYYRLSRPVNSQAEFKPQDELIYLSDVPNPRNSHRLVDHIVNSLGDQLEPGVRGQLFALLETFQEDINRSEREMAKAHMRIQQLEAELRGANLPSSKADGLPTLPD
jgi:hypothetical protein